MDINFWKITYGRHTSGDITQYILTHALPLLSLLQVILLLISINNQNNIYTNLLKYNKCIIATIGIFLFFNLMGKIIFLKYYYLPFPNIENTWLLFIFYVFSNIIIPISLLAFRKYLDLRKSLLLYSIPIIFFILNDWVAKM